MIQNFSLLDMNKYYILILGLRSYDKQMEKNVFPVLSWI